MIGPQIRGPVVRQHVRGPKGPHGGAQQQQHDRNAHVGNDNVRELRGPKVGAVAAAVEMRALPPLHDAHALQREVVQRQIDGEGHQLVKEQGDQGHDGGVLGELPEGQRGEGIGGAGRQVLGAGGGHEGDVAGQVVGVLVVGLVGEAPAVVRRQQGAVQRQADGVVGPAARRQRAVARLVRQLPEPRQHEALRRRVARPRCEAPRGAGDVRGDA